MKIAGGSVKHAQECSLNEFMRQSEAFQNLDQDALNQVYKFLLYNGSQGGGMLSHPFPAERLRYLQEWANSEEYRQIRQGNYRRNDAEGAVDIPSSAPPQEVDELRRQVEELQQKIDQLRRPQ